MDSRVKIGCFLSNIVVIAQKMLVLSQNGVGTTAPFFGLHASGLFSKQKF